MGALETHSEGHSTCFVPLEGCCTWLVRLYLQMCSSTSAGRGLREYQQGALCSNDAAGRGPGQEAYFQSLVQAQRRLLHSWEEDSRSGLPCGFPLSVVVLQFGPCFTTWLPRGSVPLLSSLSYISHPDTVNMGCRASVRCHLCCSPLGPSEACSPALETELSTRSCSAWTGP